MMRARYLFKEEDVIEEAKEIMALYRFYRLNGALYLSTNEDAIRELFKAVILAITTCDRLKAHLPHMEFVLPSRKVLDNDQGWIGHFEEIDNCKFFLSDVYDFLYLMLGSEKS